MSRGILDTLGLFVVVAFAAPVGLAGLFFLRDGRPVLAVAFLVIAALMVLLQDRLLTPADVPGAVAQRVAGAVTVDPEADPGPGDGTEDGSGSSDGASDREGIGGENRSDGNGN